MNRKGHFDWTVLTTPNLSPIVGVDAHLSLLLLLVGLFVLLVSLGYQGLGGCGNSML